MTRINCRITRIVLVSLLATIPSPTNSSMTDNEARPICGTPVLQPRSFDLLRRYGKPTPLSSLRRPVAVEVGDSGNFWAADFSSSPPSYYQITATCRAVGQNCYVFVEDQQWGKQGIDQEAVDGLVKAFDDSSKADPTRGIYQIDTDVFGEPPDVDGDLRIFILVMDIKDGHVGPGGSFYAGYFNSVNEYDPDDPELVSQFPDVRHSNFREMFYVDCNPLQLKSEQAKAVLAHEFQHLIHFGHDPDEETWVNEGCSGYAEYICGYVTRQVGRYFLAAPDNDLTHWKVGSQADYDQTLMFITYLAEHCGGDSTINQLVSEKSNGISGVDNALKRQGQHFTFQDVFASWVIANCLDGDGIYGYADFDLPTESLLKERVTSVPIPASDRRVERWAADYIEITSGMNLRIDFQGHPNKYLLQLIKKNHGNVSVYDFPLGLDNVGTLTVSDYDTLTLVVAKTKTLNDAYGYSYSAEEVTSVELAEEKFPAENLRSVCQLYQNFPNPFNLSTVIPFFISGRGQPIKPMEQIKLADRVTLEVYNTAGQRVKTLVDQELNPGRWVVEWDGRDNKGKTLSSGVYFCQLKARGFAQTRKMLLLQ